MMHTEQDYAAFLALLLLMAGAVMGALLAVGVAIGLVRRAFRARWAWQTAMAVAGAASLPLLAAFALQWPYLPELWDIDATAALLTMLNGALLVACVALPTLQHFRSRPGRR